MSRYLELFLNESREHLVAAHAIRVELARDPSDTSRSRDLMRHAHSLKSMAAVMHFPAIVELTHAAEELAEQLEDAPVVRVVECLQHLAETFASVDSMLDRIERGQELPANFPAEDASGPGTSTDRLPRPWAVDLQVNPDSPGAAQRTVAVLNHLARLGRVIHAVPPSLTMRTGAVGGQLRVVLETDRPDEHLTTELTSMLRPDEFRLCPAQPRNELTRSDDRTHQWIRVRADQFDAIADGLLDLRRSQRGLRAGLRDCPRELQQHLQRAEFRLKQIYGGVSELMLVDFVSIAERLRLAVDDLADGLGKQVRFEITGTHVRVDRVVLEALIDPLLHALRNAVDHGLETAAERVRAGKPACGSLRLEIKRSGERVHIGVEDDGRGMSPAALRRAAVERGLLAEEDAADLTDEEALRLTTLPRLTTRRVADHVSGRGVGLDMVRDRLENLGGYVDIHSGLGRGCRLELEVPLRRALIETLLLRCAGELYAVPMDAVVRCIDLRRRAEAGPLTLIRLESALGLASEGPPPPRAPALLLATPAHGVAIVVDEVIGRQALIVQPLRGPLTSIREYSGAGFLEDGSIVLVLDPTHLVPEPLSPDAPEPSA